MDIKKVGIIGLGTMGAGIIQISAEAGYDVVVLARKEESIKKGKITIEHKEAAFAKIKWTLDKKDMGDCDIIIEAAAEDMDAKKQLLRDIDEVAAPHAIIATNDTDEKDDRRWETWTQDRRRILQI